MGDDNLPRKSENGNLWRRSRGIYSIVSRRGRNGIAVFVFTGELGQDFHYFYGNREKKDYDQRPKRDVQCSLKTQHPSVIGCADKLFID
ncbi:MAG: hypothetical protein WBM17_01070 [Anaerolineales bacterium]